MTCIIMKKEFGTLTCTQGEQQVTMKAEVMVMLLPAELQ